MGSYTIINIIGEEYVNDNTKHELRRIGRPLVREFNGQVIAARYGKWRNEELKERLLSEDNGKLIYDLPIAERLDKESEGYFLIDLFEDTGDSHETELYHFRAFEGIVEKIDEFEVSNDRTGEEMEEYYSRKHDLGVRFIVA